jgi:hypothetical protein
MSAPEERKVKSLAELGGDIQPPQDLWPRIEAQLASARTATAAAGRAPLARWRWLAAAAMVASIAVGVWIGRDLVPLYGGAVVAPPVAATQGPPGGAAANAAYVSDPRYLRERDELMKSVQERLQSMPPQTRAKVAASLAAIETAKKDLESALGKNPSNALLQELLINTYQDEMRVLTDVHEAGNAGTGI